MRRIEMPAAILMPAVAAALYGWAQLASTFVAPGSIGLNMNAPGTDWMVFYGAARSFFDGNFGLIFDGERFTAYLNSTFSWWLSSPMPFRPWVYPPSYLLLVLPFGLLPFLPSYLLFQLVGAGVLAAALFGEDGERGTRSFIRWSVLISPAAAINVAAGQNAFLSTALLFGGLRMLRMRPVLGGAVLGLLTFKPQFWLLVPVALIAAREWRAFAAALAAAAALAGASALVFGVDAWRQWLELSAGAYADPTGEWIGYGRLWGDSVFACLIAAGISAGIANMAQAVAILLSAGAVYAAFRLPLPHAHKIAVALAATILAAPHSSIHDAVMLALAGALWIGTPGQAAASLKHWTLVLMLWLVPLVNPPATSLVGRMTPLLTAGFIAAILAPRLWGSATRLRTEWERLSRRLRRSPAAPVS